MKKIGIVVAMEKELQPFLALCGSYKKESYLGMGVYEFDAHPELVAICSNVGEIRAAMATTLLIERFGVDRIINYGYVGAYTKLYNAGDIVNITEVVHCDMDLTITGLVPGQYEDWQERWIVADSDFFAIPGLAKSKLSSADSFLDDCEKRRWQITEFGENVADMEGAGIAVVCKSAGKPFSMLKCVSNSMDDSYEDYYKFSVDGIDECAKLVYDAIVQIGA